MISLPNFYSRARLASELIRNPLAMKILISLYPTKKSNAESIASNFSIDLEDVSSMFEELSKKGFVRDNPTSGNKVLTERGKFFLEQTASVFKDLEEYLKEQQEGART